MTAVASAADGGKGASPIERKSVDFRSSPPGYFEKEEAGAK